MKLLHKKLNIRPNWRWKSKMPRSTIRPHWHNWLKLWRNYAPSSRSAKNWANVKFVQFVKARRVNALRVFFLKDRFFTLQDWQTKNYERNYNSYIVVYFKNTRVLT